MIVSPVVVVTFDGSDVGGVVCKPDPDPVAAFDDTGGGDGHVSYMSVVVVACGFELPEVVVCGMWWLPK